jgi:hypothetical protein
VFVCLCSAATDCPPFYNQQPAFVTKRHKQARFDCGPLGQPGGPLTVHNARCCFSALFELDFLAMSRLFIFADEAGCFNFSRKPGASRYYIVCTISCASCSNLGSSLLELRRSLIWEKAPIGEYFHASEDKQVVRDRVFTTLQQHDFSIAATIMEKSKALPRIRPTSRSAVKNCSTAWTKRQARTPRPPNGDSHLPHRPRPVRQNCRSWKKGK